MSLTDGDIAALARQAVDEVDPYADIQIAPSDPVDPYRWDTRAWSVSALGRNSYITNSMSAEDVLAKLRTDLAAH